MLVKVNNDQDLKFILEKIEDENISYITKNHAKIDFLNGDLYCYKFGQEILGIVSVVYDKKFKYFYIKRLLVFKPCFGVARMIIENILDKYSRCAITPFKTNVAMMKLMKDLNFKYNYTFLENYMFFTKEK